MRVTHEKGRFVALTDPRGVERLRYVYALSDSPKPFVHPIRLPSGAVLTADAPADHRWHHGLWFAWKLVAGVNYWEEDPQARGRQETIGTPAVRRGPGERATIRTTLEWRDATAERTLRLTERRTLSVRLDDDVLVIDWASRQSAAHDLTLDRTPYTTWGGYGGLVVRCDAALADARIVFDDGTQTQRPVGERHRWGAFAGTLRGDSASVVFLPHPTNRRFPEPFYGSARGDAHFFGPAPLFHEPLALRQGETLRHAVRVLILPRAPRAEEIAGYDGEWRGKRP